LSANFEAKKVLVDEIKNHIDNSKSIVFVNYHGISVEKDSALRKSLREAGVTYKVYKNRLVKRALDEKGLTGYDEKLLEGTNAVAFSPDETTAAGIINKAIKDDGILEFKFGFVNGTVTDKAGIEKLANIPSKPVLIAMLLGMLNAPMSALARGLNEIAKKG